MLNSVYQWAERQAGGMLARAKREHADTFEHDCLTDPFLIGSHWASQLVVRRNEPLAHAVRQTTAEYDAAGFCLPSETTGDGRFRLVINECGYEPRDYFTLLHELGHYLQRTDINLWSALFAFDDKAVAKEAEEMACNMFASKALMPDAVVMACRNAGRGDDDGDAWRADAAARLYASTRASRPAVVRRIAPLLGRGEWLTLLGRHGELKVRAHPDGAAEYDRPLDVERRMLWRFRAERREAGVDVTERTFVDVPAELSGISRQERYVRVSVAESTSSRSGSFWFVLVQREL